MKARKAPKSKSRRNFLIAAAATGGALLIGWGFYPPRQRLIGAGGALPLERGEFGLNGWVKIGTDGSVGVVVPRAEMGQGVHTALPMLLAEELDCDWGAVRVLDAPIDKIYGNVAVVVDGLPFHPDDHGMRRAAVEWIMAKVGRELGLMVTGGSSSVRDAWSAMRLAGASARAMLVAAAAQRFNAPADECRTENGWVIHKSGARAPYGELVAAASRLAPPAAPPLKDPQAFRLIGKSLPRTDVPAKVDGSAVFGMDVRLPGMLYAALRMSPAIGGDWKKYALGRIEERAGVQAIVPLPALYGAPPGVAVIAESWWVAQSALAALPITWSEGAHAGLDSAAVFDGLRRALDGNDAATHYAKGALGAGFERAAKIIEAEYRAPFLAHATMEPQNCTAHFVNGRLEIWVPTQAPSLVPWIAGKVAGIDASRVSVHATLLGGGFGRRGEMDMVAQATFLAMRSGGRPVQLIWSREEDIQHDMYRPAALSRFRAGIDAQGEVLAWWNRMASGSVMASMLGRLGLRALGPDKTNAEGSSDVPYEFANLRVEHAQVESALPLGFWRSVGHSHNAFFTECFLDELAAAAGRDPLKFRRGLLKDHPRHRAVLDLAAAQAGWGKPLAQGRSRGIALHASFGSVVAQVAEVSIEDGKNIRVHRVVCAVDCGTVVNPAIVAAQMESGIAFGLSAALYGEITLKGGKVQQSNFTDYPVLGLAEMPLVETHLVASAATPTGVGEPGTPPIAPAVANALYALTGTRFRSLPLKLKA
jgi:isoquinoline 1-oxidoreductase beta subunit